MFCTNCGYETSEGDKFCKQCGKMLIRDPEIQQQQSRQPEQVVWAESTPDKSARERKSTGIIIGLVIAGGVILMIFLGCLLLWAQSRASDSLERWRNDRGGQYQTEEWSGYGHHEETHDYGWDGC